MTDRSAALARALHSLDGLSVGDAFGEACLVDTRTLLARLEHRWLPDPPWTFSDDTVMAISVVETWRSTAPSTRTRSPGASVTSSASTRGGATGE